jgi:hypothetical protein
MRLPGFTAEAAATRSPRRYREYASSSGKVKGVVAQIQGGGSCLDSDCLSWCEAHSPFPETCYDGCQVPCDPLAPPEVIPPPG